MMSTKGDGIRSDSIFGGSWLSLDDLLSAESAVTRQHRPLGSISSCSLLASMSFDVFLNATDSGIPTNKQGGVSYAQQTTTRASFLTEKLAAGDTRPCIAATSFPYDYEGKPQSPGSRIRHTVAKKFTLPANVLESISALSSLVPAGERALNKRAIVATALSIDIADYCGTNDVLFGHVTATGRVSPIRFSSFNKNWTDIFYDVSAQIAHPFSTNDIESAIKDGALSGQYSDIMISPYGMSLATHKPTLGCEIHKDSLVWHVDSARFHAATISRIHERLVHLLNTIATAAVSDPSALMSAPRPRESLPEAELALLRLWEVGSIRPLNTEPIGLHHLVERQAQRVPGNVAVTDAEGRSITYDQLNAAADIVAGNLRVREAGPGQRIAILLPRCLELFVVVLGVLKSGAAYVPLDPTYPADRFQFILEDSGCSIVICTEELMVLVPPTTEAKCASVADLLAVGDSVSADGHAGTQEHFDQSNLLVILYTSGTTGKPKGVAIEHRNAHVFLENNMWDPVTEDDVWAQMSNPCFIGSFNDIWLPLTRGSAISIIPKDALVDIARLGDVIKERGVTCLFLTPKLLELYADSDPAIFNGLKLIQFAGEAVRADAVLKLAGRVKHLQHLYGCTERTGCIAGYPVPDNGLPAAVAKVARLPIGRPIDNTQAYILDKDMTRVPIGCTGELYVGGPQITRGYLNREDVTREKFIPNPFDGGLMYRTGDLARWLPDGNGLDLLGRADTMVKIRGYRVELGEIEAEIMSANLGLSAAVATTYEPQPGNIMLVAYVAPNNVDTQALRAHLQTRLPDFMMPTYISTISAIPLNHNGKVDKRALPSPMEQQSNIAALAPPVTPNEKFVVSVWSKIIGIPADVIGLHSKFVELGGNSFMATKLLHALREKCPALQMIDLMEADTPYRTAKRMDTDDRPDVLPDEIVQFSRGAERAVFIVHGGLGIVDWLAPIGIKMSKRGLYGLQLTAAAVSAAKASDDYYNGMCAHYAGCIRKVQPSGPYTLGGVSLGSVIALGIAANLESQGEVIDRIISLDMPAIKFDKRTAYASATCVEEKAPLLMVKRLTHFYSSSISNYDEMLAKLECELDKEILGTDNNDNSYDENEAFVKMTSMFRFLVGVGMPQDLATLYLGNLATMADLFIDPIERGLRTSADIDVAIASDNRLLAHTLKACGYSHLLDDYGWGCVTSGNVSSWVAEGDHITMIMTDEGIEQFAACFDRF